MQKVIVCFVALARSFSERGGRKRKGETADNRRLNLKGRRETCKWPGQRTAFQPGQSPAASHGQGLASPFFLGRRCPFSGGRRWITASNRLQQLRERLRSRPLTRRVQTVAWPVATDWSKGKSCRRTGSRQVANFFSVAKPATYSHPGSTPRVQWRRRRPAPRFLTRLQFVHQTFAGQGQDTKTPVSQA